MVIPDSGSVAAHELFVHVCMILMYICIKEEDNGNKMATEASL